MKKKMINESWIGNTFLPYIEFLNFPETPKGAIEKIKDEAYQSSNVDARNIIQFLMDMDNETYTKLIASQKENREMTESKEIRMLEDLAEIYLKEGKKAVRKRLKKKKIIDLDGWVKKVRRYSMGIEEKINEGKEMKNKNIKINENVGPFMEKETEAGLKKKKKLFIGEEVMAILKRPSVIRTLIKDSKENEDSKKIFIEMVELLEKEPEKVKKLIGEGKYYLVKTEIASEVGMMKAIKKENAMLSEEDYWDRDVK